MRVCLLLLAALATLAADGERADRRIARPWALCCPWRLTCPRAGGRRGLSDRAVPQRCTCRLPAAQLSLRALPLSPCRHHRSLCGRQGRLRHLQPLEGQVSWLANDAAHSTPPPAAAADAAAGADEYPPPRAGRLSAWLQVPELR